MKRILALIAATTLTLTGFTAPAGAAKPAMELKGRVYFSDSSSELSKAAKRELRKVYGNVSDAPMLRVVGFVQTGNGEANNSSLSANRAKAVKKYLKRLGFEGRISAAGKGLAPTNPSRAESRRASVWTPVESGVELSASLLMTNVVFNYCAENSEISGPLTAVLKDGSTVVDTYTFECAIGDGAASATLYELPAGEFSLEINYESYWYCENTWVVSPWTVEECGGDPFRISISTPITLELDETTEIALLVVPWD
jgi:hypothetical protein